MSSPAGQSVKFTRTAWERFAPATGLVFLVLGGIGNVALFPSGAPDFVDEPAKIAAFYEKEQSAILTTDLLNLISAPFLLWFIGSLRSVLRRAEGAEGRVSGIAFAGGTAGVALLMAAAAVDSVAALRVEEQGEIDTVLATALWDISNILFGAAAMMGLAVLLVATAVVALRHDALPKWLGALSLLIGIGLAVPPIAFFVFFAFLVWVLVTSIVLLLAGGREGHLAADLR